MTERKTSSEVHSTIHYKFGLVKINGALKVNVGSEWLQVKNRNLDWTQVQTEDSTWYTHDSETLTWKPTTEKIE